MQKKPKTYYHRNAESQASQEVYEDYDSQQDYDKRYKKNGF